MNFFKEENRLASILHVIETGPDTQVEKLASQLSVSTKTVKNDIKELNYAQINYLCGYCFYCY